MFIAGCAAPPAADISAADIAVAGAETAEAPSYAPAEFKIAQDAKTALQAELTVQEGKFAPLRSYARATELAATAKSAAEAAQQQAVAEKDRVRAEAVQLLSDAKIALEGARALLATAPTGKGTQADLATMASDLNTADSSLLEANSAIQANNYMEARNKAQAAMQAAAQVRTAVEQAMAARGVRPRT
jgi:hypothetical protein